MFHQGLEHMHKRLNVLFRDLKPGRLSGALGSAAAFFESIAVLGNVVPNAINDQRIV